MNFHNDRTVICGNIRENIKINSLSEISDLIWGFLYSINYLCQSEQTKYFKEKLIVISCLMDSADSFSNVPRHTWWNGLSCRNNFNKTFQFV